MHEKGYRFIFNRLAWVGSAVAALSMGACSYESGYLYKKKRFQQNADMDPEEIPPVPQKRKPIPAPPGPPTSPERPGPLPDAEITPPAPRDDAIPGPPRPPTPPPAPAPSPGHGAEPMAPTPQCPEFSLDHRIINGADDVDLGPVAGRDCIDLNLRFDSGFDETTMGSTRMRPLAVYFVLDASPSMEHTIAAVRRGVLGFVDRLEEHGFDVQLGLTTFDATVFFVDDLTSDVSAFRDRVGSIDVSGGAGPHEASLNAVQRSFEKMATLDDEVVKAVFVVTDEVGHNGEPDAGFGGHCNIDPLVSYLNSFSDSQQRMMKIYYSVDTGTSCAPRAGGDPWPSAPAQWQAVLDSTLPSVDRSLRGGALDYPPSSTSIIDDFADLLVETTPDVRKVCLTRNATLVLGAGTESIRREWRATSLTDVRSTFNRGDSITEWVPLWFDDIDSQRGQPGEISIARCCYLEENLDSSSFSTCTDERTQTVRFAIAR